MIILIFLDTLRSLYANVNMDDLCSFLRATPRDSLYFFLLLGIEILMEIYPPTASLSGYLNVAILHFTFLASQR